MFRIIKGSGMNNGVPLAGDGCVIMVKLKPFFVYYGGKYRAAPKYPRPIYKTIVEPFAGAAGYSVRYPDRSIVLFDKDPVIYGLWRYLIQVTEHEILSIPDIDLNGSVDDLTSWPQETKWLVGFWLNKGVESPRKSPSAWMNKYAYPHRVNFWGDSVRNRIANQLQYIRHWKVANLGYEDISGNLDATWFIDPPYQDKGKRYKCSSRDIDFSHLYQWCDQREGQLIVCENEGATWAPFKKFGDIRSMHGRSKEVIWTRGCGTK